MLDQLARANGFKDAAEMERMVASVNLADRKTFGAFMVWKEVDGAKKGLEDILADGPEEVSAP